MWFWLLVSTASARSLILRVSFCDIHNFQREERHYSKPWRGGGKLRFQSSSAPCQERQLRYPFSGTFCMAMRCQPSEATLKYQVKESVICPNSQQTHALPQQPTGEQAGRGNWSWHTIRVKWVCKCSWKPMESKWKSGRRYFQAEFGGERSRNRLLLRTKFKPSQESRFSV